MPRAARGDENGPVERDHTVPGSPSLGTSNGGRAEGRAWEARPSVNSPAGSELQAEARRHVHVDRLRGLKVSGCTGAGGGASLSQLGRSTGSTFPRDGAFCTVLLPVPVPANAGALDREAHAMPPPATPARSHAIPAPARPAMSQPAVLPPSEPGPPMPAVGSPFPVGVLVAAGGPCVAVGAVPGVDVGSGSTVGGMLTQAMLPFCTVASI